MAGSYDWTIQQGDTFYATLTIKEDDEAVDITGWVFTSMFREKYSDTSPQATATCTVEDGAAGTLSMQIANTDTAAMTATKGVWDIQYIKPDTSVSTLLRGNYTLLLEATK